MTVTTVTTVISATAAVTPGKFKFKFKLCTVTVTDHIGPYRPSYCQRPRPLQWCKCPDAAGRRQLGSGLSLPLAVT